MPSKRSRQISTTSSDSFNCCSCEKPDSADNMVQCDMCDGWNHLSCAGVDSSIESKPYVCSNCSGKSRNLSTSTSNPPAVRLYNDHAHCQQEPNCVDTATTTAFTQHESQRISVADALLVSNVTHSAPSAAEVAAGCGAIVLPSSSKLYTSTANVTHSAPSAAEVVAKCGSQLFVPVPNLFRTSSALTNSITTYSNANVPHYVDNAFNTNLLPTAVPGLPLLLATSAASVVSTSRTNTGLPTLLVTADSAAISAPCANTALHTSKMKTQVPAYSATEVAAMRGCVNRQPRASSNASSTSRASKSQADRCKLELQRIAEEKLMQEYLDKEELRLRKQREEKYLKKKYTIMSQVLESSDDDEELVEAEPSTYNKQRIDNWMTEMPERNYFHSTTNAETNPPELTSSAHQPSYQSRFKEMNISQQKPPCTLIPHHHADVVLNHNERPVLQENVRMPQHHVSLPNELLERSLDQPPPQVEDVFSSAHHTAPHSSSHVQCTLQSMHSSPGLTQNNIAARNLIRDLPFFDGKPSEWPLFIASYNRSTELGGFSNEENLIRLHKALKGDALEAVKSLIIQPNCVGRVIETLKMLFGRPELIINTLIQAINCTPAPKADKFDTIVNFAIAVQNLCATFEASGVGNGLNYPTLLQELVEKLPPTLKLNWAIHKQTLPFCTLIDFSKWIYAVAEAANGVLISAPTSSKSSPKTKSWNKGAVNNHYKELDRIDAKPTTKCCICDSDCVSVADCERFLHSNRTARWAEVRKHHLCSKCLGKHARYRCDSESICGINSCKSKHHRLLHKYETSCRQTEAATVGVHAKLSPNTSKLKTNSVLFRIVPVLLYGKNAMVKVFALLDDGSSVTLLDEEVAKQLHAKGEKRPLCLKWTGNTSRLESQSELINLRISGTGEAAEKFQLTNVHTVSKLALPAQTVNRNELQSQYEHLKEAYFDSYNSAVPQLLIGVNNAKLGQPLKSKEGGWKEPIASKTRLGWVVHGSCGANEAKVPTDTYNFHICDCNGQDLQQLVNDFICNDNYFGASGENKVVMSDDDSRALDILRSKTVQKDGHYETSLLWKFDDVRLPDSYPMARRRLKCLQTRMNRDQSLAKTLDLKIREYQAKGYARKLSNQEIKEAGSRSWYLPIFPVVNVNKPGKIRLVWDAAATVCGTSLNSVLLKGPDQLTPLISVIFKFREQRIAICGDIQEMFHQVKIRKEDQHFQRFLWGCNENGNPDTYVMTVMTFGATCSPCTAHFVKNTNADKFIKQYPRAVRSIKENHYVDDLMDSVSTEEEAINLARQIRFIHKEGGFHIRNWVSNSAKVLKALGYEPTEQINMNMSIELGTEKVLGMWWCTLTDCLTFRLLPNQQIKDVISGNKRPTKREVLRILMTIFDPLGLIACVLMYIKILLQDIWRSKIEWDEVIKDEEYKKWDAWLKILPAVEKVKIPRCYITTSWIPETHLHIFVDASENGYAAVAYVRNACTSGLSESRLIGAKTRVAPLKSLSVPRLELQAALLGARFAKTIIDSHSITFSRRFFWSDSKTVLCWLRSDHRRYRQFVAFRVSEILDLTTVEEWRWISTKANVADEATKWQKTPDLTPASRWFRGPKFLELHPDRWPNEQVVGSTKEDLKTNFLGIHIQAQAEIYRVEALSKWTTLLRSTAYVHRFIHNTSTKRTKLPKLSGHLTKQELQNAENYLFQEAQNSEYGEEVADLATNRCIPKSSSILMLNPFLDENKILRANSRICLVKNLRADFKYPIILPKQHKITSLLIHDVHLKYWHQNDESVVNVLRQRFYIPHIRAALKAVKKLCQHCKNKKAQPRPPIMAPLPPARLGSFCRPFSYVGIDYFGPMIVTVGRRNEKRWGVLFTCLTIRAIHLEVAHSLTSDSCILCLRNFIARRGTPLEFHSDNGTNFQGAERELREAWSAMHKDQLTEAFTTPTTAWKFITPGAPHMGGCWERLVRSVKSALYSALPSRNPSDELLRSILIEIENIINSRPLTYIPVDPENSEALTPNHFLLGSACGSKPAAQFNDDVSILRRNWLISQQFAVRFWKRWVSEYLPTLTRRAKWLTPTRPLEVGDVVLIVDPNSPRNSWPMGRIIKVKISLDGQVRSATVQTQNGIYDRPVVKLALLDVEGRGPCAELPGGSVGANAPLNNI